MIRKSVFTLIAQLCHLYFGFGLITALLFYGGLKTALWGSGIYCLVIAIKEAFIDPVTETTDEAGSGWLDFGTNMAGALLGWGVYFLVTHLLI